MHDRPIVARLRRFGRAPHARARRNPAPRPRLRSAGNPRRRKACRPCWPSADISKNTVAIAVGQDVFLSQHIGDLETLEARGAFETRDRRPLPPLQLQARSRRLRPASRLCVDALGREVRPAADPRPASSGARGGLRRREQRRRTVPRRLVGRHRIRPRRRHLGRRVLPWSKGTISSASRTCARSDCPAAMPRSAKAGVRRPACYLKLSARILRAPMLPPS